MSALTNPASPSIRVLTEPAPCVPPIKGLRGSQNDANATAFGRAIFSVVAQRLDPDAVDQVPLLIETTRLGGRHLCLVRAITSGHFNLTLTAADSIVQLLQEATRQQIQRPTQQRAEVVLLVAWRKRGSGADPCLHIWALPEAIVSDMGVRVGHEKRNTVRLTLPRPRSPRSLWVRNKADPAPIGVHDYYWPWALSREEHECLQGAEEDGGQGPPRRGGQNR